MARARTAPPPEKKDDEPSDHDLDEARYSDDGPPSVHVALSRVMADVQSISKEQRNTQQNYNFRGVDAVVNAVGPALREHGVIVVPTHVEYDDERYQTKKGAEMKGVTVRITFRFYGPNGDFVEAMAAGEAADAGDKAMPKAHSVAYRTLLLQALCIPTDEPDPDAVSVERAAVDRQPVVRDNQTAPPRSRAELITRWVELLGNGDEAKAAREWWHGEAIEQLFPGKTGPDLNANEMNLLGQKLTTAFLELVDNPAVERDPFGIPSRAAIKKALALSFGDAKIDGPPWAMPLDEDEERPTFEAYQANLEAERAKRVEAGQANDDDIPFGDDPPGQSPVSDGS